MNLSASRTKLGKVSSFCCDCLPDSAPPLFSLSCPSLFSFFWFFLCSAATLPFYLTVVPPLSNPTEALFFLFFFTSVPFPSLSCFLSTQQPSAVAISSPSLSQFFFSFAAFLKPSRHSPGFFPSWLRLQHLKEPQNLNLRWKAEMSNPRNGFMWPALASLIPFVLGTLWSNESNGKKKPAAIFFL